MTLPPNVDERVQNDVDVQLWLGRPDSPSETPHYERAYEFYLRDAHDITLSYSDGSDHNALTFSMYKDSPGAHELTGDWEVVVRWHDPRRNELVEPPGSRFVILNTQDDAADNTNRITYQCASITWLLEKVRVRTTGYVRNARAMNRDYDRAKERYEEAEREYNQLRRNFERIGRQVQEETWPNNSHGPMLLSYSGVTWLIRDGHARYRTLVYNDYNGLIYWYSFQRQGMVRLNMNLNDDFRRNRRRELRDAGRDALRAMTRMRTARTNYNNAERAQRETSRDGTRYFYNRTPGRVLATLWMEGGERDSGFVGHEDGSGSFESPYSYRSRVLKGVWRGWTTTRDAKNRPWVNTTTRGNWEIRLGQSLWQVIQDFRERGEIDIRMGGAAPGGGGRSLYAVPKGGLVVDQSRRVALKLGTNVEEAPETIDRTNHQTISFVLDSSGYNRYTHWNRSLAANETPWGYWEGAIQEQDANSLRSARNLTAEERRKRSRRFWIDASRKGPVLPGGPIPMLDYEPHHLVSVYDHQGSGSVRSVTQIIVEKSSPEEPIKATIRLGQRITNGRVSYQKTMSKITGGSDHMQGHIPMAPGEAALTLPQDALNAPAIEDMGAAVRFNEDGRPRVALTATVVSHDIAEPEDAASFEASEAGQELLFDEEYEGT